MQAAKEARIRLLTGIKRYVHAKRAEGLLSPEGLLRLDEACDRALDDPDKYVLTPSPHALRILSTHALWTP